MFGSVLDRSPMRRHLFALLCLLSLLLATHADYGRVRGSGRRHSYRHRGGYGYGVRGHGYGRPRSDRYGAGGHAKPLGGHRGDYDRPRNAEYGGYGRPPPTQTPPCNAPCYPYAYGLPGAEKCTCPGPEPETTPAPRPETTTAPPTADHDITIAFFAAKPSGGAEFRRKRDGANSSLPDDAILMNALVDAWSDSLSEGKLTITFIPYADIPASPVTMTTVKDAKDFISNTYAELPALPAGKDPSQLAVVKAYQSRPTAQAKKLTKVDLVLINVSLTGNTYFSPQTRVDDMAATGKVLKDISTQPNQLATVVAGSNTTAEDMQFYGDVGPSVSIVPEARMHLQELANMFTCTMCTLGDITLTPGTVTPTGTGPTIGVDKCADLTVTCANPGGTVFMQFNVGEGGPAIGETVTAVLDCVNGKWEYAPADQPSRPITEVNCVST